MAKYGIYEKALLDEDFKKSLQYAKQQGYDFWEISIDKERKHRLSWDQAKVNEVLMLCNDTEMPIYNMVLSLHRDYPMGSFDNSVREKSLNYLVEAIDLASKLGIRAIQLAGYYTSEGKENGDLETYIKTLTKGVSYAAQSGVILAIENMDYDLIDTKAILYVVEKINNPFLKMFLDVGNFAANELDPIEELEEALPHLVGLHLKETKVATYRRVAFGDGIVNFEKIFNYLKENKYEGYFGIEMWNDNDPESLVTIKEALEWLKKQKK